MAGRNEAWEASTHLIDFDQRDAGSAGDAGDLRGVGTRGEIDQQRGIGAATREWKRTGGEPRLGNARSIWRGGPAKVARNFDRPGKHRESWLFHYTGDTKRREAGAHGADEEAFRHSALHDDADDQRIGIRDGQREEVEAALAFLFFGAVAIGAIRGEESANRGSGGVLGDERERAGREGGEDNAREPAGDGGKAGCTDHVRRGRGRGGYRC